MVSQSQSKLWLHRKICRLWASWTRLRQELIPWAYWRYLSDFLALFKAQEAEAAMSKSHLDAARVLCDYKLEVAARHKDLALAYDLKLSEHKEEANATQKAELAAIEGAKNAHIQVIASIPEPNASTGYITDLLNQISSLTLQLHTFNLHQDIVIYKKGD